MTTLALLSVLVSCPLKSEMHILISFLPGWFILCLEGQHFFPVSLLHSPSAVLPLVSVQCLLAELSAVVQRTGSWRYTTEDQKLARFCPQGVWLYLATAKPLPSFNITHLRGENMTRVIACCEDGGFSGEPDKVSARRQMLWASLNTVQSMYPRGSLYRQKGYFYSFYLAGGWDVYRSLLSCYNYGFVFFRICLNHFLSC